QRPEWLLPWIETFSPQPIVAVAVRFKNRLVGFAPCLTYRRESDTVLAFMGGGISDYLDFLVDPAYETQVVMSIQQAVASIPDWTFLELTDLPGKSLVKGRTEWSPKRQTSQSISSKVGAAVAGERRSAPLPLTPGNSNTRRHLLAL